MLLSPDDAALFYRAWSALLTWVNDRRNIAPRFARPTPEHPLDPSLANKIKDVVRAEDALREQFLAEGSADLGPEERDLVASWTHRVSGNFVILKHLQKHSVFLNEDAYGVLGIYTPLEVMFPSVPVFVEAVLGGGARRMLNAQYSAARAASQMRTTLPWRADATTARPSHQPKPMRRSSRRQPR
jgi:hypothetical protein